MSQLPKLNQLYSQIQDRIANFTIANQSAIAMNPNPGADASASFGSTSIFSTSKLLQRPLLESETLIQFSNFRGVTLMDLQAARISLTRESERSSANAIANVATAMTVNATHLSLYTCFPSILLLLCKTDYCYSNSDTSKQNGRREHSCFLIQEHPSRPGLHSRARHEPLIRVLRTYDLPRVNNVRIALVDFFMYCDTLSHPVEVLIMHALAIFRRACSCYFSNQHMWSSQVPEMKLCVVPRFYQPVYFSCISPLCYILFKYFSLLKIGLFSTFTYID